jgi:hypothetical protein
MFRTLVLALVAVLIAGSASAQSGFAGRPITSNAFGKTGYTLHKNEFQIGLGPIAFGLHENLLLWAFQVYNVDAKAAVVKKDDQAFALGVSLYRLSLDLVNGNGDDFSFHAVAPYASYSHRLGESIMGHVGGQYAYFTADNDDADIDDAEASASATGTSFFAGIEYSLSNRTKALFDGAYDTTFEGARISGAFLFGWQRFRLKLGLSYFAVEDEGFTFPLVGLWWRFDA